MLTLNIIGKKFTADSLNDENDVKILIEPAQFTEVKKILESNGFTNIILEDDEGNLYVNASRKIESETQKQEKEKEKEPEAVKSEKKNENIQPVVSLAKHEIIKNSTGVLISCESSKYNSIFMKKFLLSLVNSRIKPDLIALINGGVKIAAYNSSTCEYLKKLEAESVKILISDSCADRIGITEAIGVGSIIDMSEILEEIFKCERVVNV